MPNIEPRPITRPLAALKTEPPNPATPKRPVLLNFHGGGFSIGHPLDDSRWAGTVLSAFPDSVVVSIAYRLAPEHPFPVPIEDGVDAVHWLWRHAEHYNLDRARFVLSGFSAGGNLAFTVPLRLHEELEKLQLRGTPHEVTLAGIVAFYPSVDWSRTREERDESNPVSAQKSMIAPGVLDFFDESYLLVQNLPRKPGSRVVDMSDKLLSPGLAPSCLLLSALPSCVAIYTCGWDQLLVEGNAFRERLKRFADEGKMEYVGGFVLEETVHGFDKRPSFCMANEMRDRMYGDGVQQLGIMWQYNKLEE
ncbi:hypothetical protein N7470_004595 [Penicillium chermesinum]|nr:hypothetical protein N7470_004595 [Penicillium chermesinum]